MPSKHEALNQCCFNVGPVVDGWPKLKQHWFNALCLLSMCDDSNVFYCWESIADSVSAVYLFLKIHPSPPPQSDGVIQNKAATDTIRQAKIVPASQMIGNAEHAKTTLDQRTYGF